MSYDWVANLFEAFGPIYPELGAKVAKSRGLARNHPIWRREHGLVVLAAIRAKQRAELQRGLAPDSRPMCASGTLHTDGAAILKAVREQHARAFTAAIEADRKRRTDATIVAAYDAAMVAKRARAARTGV